MRQLSPKERRNSGVLETTVGDFAYLQPTATGLSKSILDAIGPLRDYLRREGVHDYSIQRQGPENKRELAARLITDAQVVTTTASLYRPKTKQGDPRIWFKGLPEMTSPNDILGIVAKDGVLYVFNLTNGKLAADLAAGRGSAALEVLDGLESQTERVAVELLRKLRVLARNPLPARGIGPMAVGHTLEFVLGIAANSRRIPDYKGVEIKSRRGRHGNARTLFAQVPDWDISRLRSSAEILKTFGYRRNGIDQLHVTVSAVAPNSRGLRLSLDVHSDHLREISTRAPKGLAVAWRMSAIRRRLEEKHAETFWISAREILIRGRRHFAFDAVEHTKGPYVGKLEQLISQGHVRVDHLIRRREGRLKEHGPLFRWWGRDFSELFPPGEVHSLR